MWGTQHNNGDHQDRQRFIPTHVGNTRSSLTAYSSTSVHPHACGEHVWASTEGAYSGGSSPRMWGTRLPFHQDPRRLRFIPTHVGNTTDFAIGDLLPTVHPHACGEHFRNIDDFFRGFGSSPRMWGTRRIQPVSWI